MADLTAVTTNMNTAVLVATNNDESTEIAQPLFPIDTGIFLIMIGTLLLFMGIAQAIQSRPKRKTQKSLFKVKPYKPRKK